MAALLLEYLPAIAAVLIGACVGSFLNVCIYRLPRDLSVRRPARSFCPACRTSLPWYCNIPVVSWLVLRGRCAQCSARISLRYPVVELTTALLFVALWQRDRPDWVLALAHAVFISLCIAAAWIDWEHLIIPDEINYTGVVLGFLAAAAAPSLFGVERVFHSLGQAAYGAFLGFGLIWLVILAGKLAFGRAQLKFEALEKWDIAQPDPENEPRLRVAGHEYCWSDMFCRPGVDRLRIQGAWFAVDGERHDLNGELVVTMTGYRAGDLGGLLEGVERLEGEAEKIVIPREAMGLGDAKFMAMTGAFLGWKGVLFGIFGGSILATSVWIVCWLAGKAERSRQIPFGPYLAAAAVLWVFAGPALLQAYAGMTGGLVRELLLR